ncbi:hypothetical protein KIL84_000438 [Mauremys mutica]|uniref:Uncharacterized protein n=1 Tax=Mauremys mutica TaxID=74926 RepID=A0A9D3XFU5_9SAUR|nr:hypothetical protein KIL84_000438 [Mauremys mutica]
MQGPLQPSEQLTIGKAQRWHKVISGLPPPRLRTVWSASKRLHSESDPLIPVCLLCTLLLESRDPKFTTPSPPGPLYPQHKAEPFHPGHLPQMDMAAHPGCQNKDLQIKPQKPSIQTPYS